MDRQCSSCGGFCKKSGCERENVKPEQEPVAWISHNAGLYHGKPDESLNPLPLYTAPQKKEWVGLTDEEINDHWINAMWNTEGTRLPIPEFARAIEAALKAKNGYSHD